MSTLTTDRPARGSGRFSKLSRSIHSAVNDPIHVLKFGGSVLTNTPCYTRAAAEIYRQNCKGRKIVAVVSAPLGWTDKLMASGSAAAGTTDAKGISEVVSLGEDYSAGMLRLACERIGLSARVMSVSEAGLHADGDELDADPCSLDSKAVLEAVRQHDLVIVSGFVGIREDGSKALLGRGGTDTTAVFVAGEIGADKVRLFKDVDGVYNCDPAGSTDARRFRTISWDDAYQLAGPLIHAKALLYARSREIPIEVGLIASPSPTRVTHRSLLAEPSAQRPKDLKVAIAGCGTVGQELVRLIELEQDVAIKSVLVKDLRKQREVPDHISMTDNVEAFLATDADIFIDTLSCERTGLDIAESTLSRGACLVTASKRLVASNLVRLASLASKGDGHFRYSAAVGGSMPLVENLAGIEAGKVKSVTAILNGTSNFVLEKLYHGQDLDLAISAARKAGFAEADCSQDLQGLDAAAKLKIIAYHAFGIDPSNLSVETAPLTPNAADYIACSGMRYFQVATVKSNGDAIDAKVELVPGKELPSELAVSGEGNAAHIVSEHRPNVTISGRGAGGHPTAQSILSDLMTIKALLAGRV